MFFRVFIWLGFVKAFVGDAAKIGARILVSPIAPPSHYYALNPLRDTNLNGCDQRFNATTSLEDELTVSRIRRFFEIQTQIRTLENVDISIIERASRTKMWLGTEDQRVRAPTKLFSAQLWQEWSEVDAAAQCDDASISPTTCS